MYPGSDYVPSTDKAKSVAFAPNSRRISALMERKNISSDCKDIKYVVVENVGHVYYIDNGESKLLAATNYGSVNGNVFNGDNVGLIEINDDFKAFADQELAELEEFLKFLETQGPDYIPPMGGTDTPSFMVDNTPYLDGAENQPVSGSGDNPNTGGTGSAVACDIALTACVIGISAAKKKKTKK